MKITALSLSFYASRNQLSTLARSSHEMLANVVEIGCFYREMLSFIAGLNICDPIPNLSITDIHESQKSYPKEYRVDFPLADNRLNDP